MTFPNGKVVEYEGRRWRVLGEERKTVLLCPEHEAPATDNTRRIDRGILAAQLDPPKKARPMDDRRWKRAHHTGSG